LSFAFPRCHCRHISRLLPIFLQVFTPPFAVTPFFIIFADITLLSSSAPIRHFAMPLSIAATPRHDGFRFSCCRFRFHYAFTLRLYFISFILFISPPIAPMPRHAAFFTIPPMPPLFFFFAARHLRHYFSPLFADAAAAFLSLRLFAEPFLRYFDISPPFLSFSPLHFDFLSLPRCQRGNFAPPPLRTPCHFTLPYDIFILPLRITPPLPAAWLSLLIFAYFYAADADFAMPFRFLQMPTPPCAALFAPRAVAVFRQRHAAAIDFRISIIAPIFAISLCQPHTTPSIIAAFDMPFSPFVDATSFSLFTLPLLFSEPFLLHIFFFPPPPAIFRLIAISFFVQRRCRCRRHARAAHVRAF